MDLKQLNQGQDNLNAGIAIDNLMKAKLTILSYAWLGYFALITAIVTLTPNCLLQLNAVKYVAISVTSISPYVSYLASLSEEPDVINFAFCITFMSAPLHAILAFTIVILSSMSGYHSRHNLNIVLRFGWLVILIVYLIFFTCLRCLNPPRWQELFAISSSLIIAIVGQIMWVGPSICIGAYLVIILRKLGIVQTKTNAEVNNG